VLHCGPSRGGLSDPLPHRTGDDGATKPAVPMLASSITPTRATSIARTLPAQAWAVRNEPTAMDPATTRRRPCGTAIPAVSQTTPSAAVVATPVASQGDVAAPAPVATTVIASAARRGAPAPLAAPLHRAQDGMVQSASLGVDEDDEDDCSRDALLEFVASGEFDLAMPSPTAWEVSCPSLPLSCLDEPMAGASTAPSSRCPPSQVAASIRHPVETISCFGPAFNPRSHKLEGRCTKRLLCSRPDRHRGRCNAHLSKGYGTGRRVEGRVSETLSELGSSPRSDSEGGERDWQEMDRRGPANAGRADEDVFIKARVWDGGEKGLMADQLPPSEARAHSTKSAVEATGASASASRTSVLACSHDVSHSPFARAAQAALDPNSQRRDEVIAELAALTRQYVPAVGSDACPLGAMPDVSTTAVARQVADLELSLQLLRSLVDNKAGHSAMGGGSTRSAS